MKKISKDIIAFIIPLIIIIVLIDIFSFTSIGNDILGRITYSTGYTRSGSADVRTFIQKVREDNEATKLIVGDSVARQLFEGLQEENPDYCIATCNQALTFAGQYLLIDSFLENHPNTTDVYLCVVPMSLRADLDASLGYNYVVAPFAKEGLLERLDNSTLEYMEEKYGNLFMQSRMVDFIDDSPINAKIYLNYIREKEQKENGETSDVIVSDVNILYLNKINELCEENNVKLHLFSGPVPDNRDQRTFIDKLEIYAQENNYILLKEYVETVLYYDKEMFSDGTHLGDKYENRENIFRILKDMRKMIHSFD